MEGVAEFLITMLGHGMGSPSRNKGTVRVTERGREI